MWTSYVNKIIKNDSFKFFVQGRPGLGLQENQLKKCVNGKNQSINPRLDYTQATNTRTMICKWFQTKRKLTKLHKCFIHSHKLNVQSVLHSIVIQGSNRKTYQSITNFDHKTRKKTKKRSSLVRSFYLHTIISSHKPRTESRHCRPEQRKFVFSCVCAHSQSLD